MPTDFASGSAPAAPTAFFSGDALLDSAMLANVLLIRLDAMMPSIRQTCQQ